MEISSTEGFLPVHRYISKRLFRDSSRRADFKQLSGAAACVANGSHGFHGILSHRWNEKQYKDACGKRRTVSSGISHWNQAFGIILSSQDSFHLSNSSFNFFTEVFVANIAIKGCMPDCIAVRPVVDMKSNAGWINDLDTLSLGPTVPVSRILNR
ncbi:hypothetical protein [Comamonas endophytica]|uniref:Uncharacterized protein n=1 Tax=Comamonas endophytica TaxID=2949090 RepID=A0ABY6GH39_9BURK|nr:hypothetical protein [Acidovorax sp. 5MLIR]UYG53588.1 hypothetical protein M9799_19705 [Acidovorax sp. 5MLIR]UYG53635.1 hypothetical protein M9799_16970 [Acidovorax sp. 5MLIR]